ncbi:hypothetical protein [Elizabethkingia sp. JS20170427COW]|uniref:hypothetical protein n=1 Tax=Elizabethkingia sp. JS20170427COW TaxID=2583851 RepID=UPI001110E44D|nr:hypothetical protein [Elizabethkingia sp. JS20170427COW]QCX52939.1 hypothetical protein FGE20_03885 [Elizabethkingia sp. JS20170427COW]
MLNFFRNTFAVLLGLAVAGLIITFGVRLNPDWVTYPHFTPFESWGHLLFTIRDKSWFFVTLLLASGVGATFGGVVTAMLVKYAKVAYAILIGFILLFIAMLDIIIFPYHPTFYKILIFVIYFPASWIGGKIVEVISNSLQKFKK